MNHERAIKVSMALAGIRTQSQLSESSGVTQSAISNIISGKSKPTRITINKLVMALGINVETYKLRGE